VGPQLDEVRESIVGVRLLGRPVAIKPLDVLAHDFDDESLRQHGAPHELESRVAQLSEVGVVGNADVERDGKHWMHRGDPLSKVGIATKDEVRPAIH
jgi:hypothetical protein